MSKKLWIGAAIGALMAAGAFAQAPSLSSSSTPPAASTSGKADFITSQKPDQWVASKFKGTDVLGPDNQKVGTIDDVLFDKSGKIEAYVVSVGGFLGVGSKEIALAPKSFIIVPGQNGNSDQLKITMTKDELKNAQAFARYEPPRPSTTGAGGGLNSLGGRQSVGGMHPSGGMNR
jgi:sporulation protein YlmC with PRC-barrel domain